MIKPGQRYGRWRVLRAAATCVKRGVRYPRWVCKCSCGTVTSVLAWNLSSGKSRSCGCLARLAAYKHGQWKTRVYSLWVGMLSRCKYPNVMHYREYGGRGIKVCERWKIFANFYDDMGDPPSPRHSLDRYPDVDGNYEPGNVRWATAAQQNRNQRRTKLSEEKAAEIRRIGRSIPQRVIAAQFGVSRGMVGHIIRGKAWV